MKHLLAVWDTSVTNTDRRIPALVEGLLDSISKVAEKADLEVEVSVTSSVTASSFLPFSFSF